MIIVFLISLFLFLFFGMKVEEFIYAYVEKIYVTHSDKDPMVTCIVTHIMPLWMGIITFLGLLATIEQAKHLVTTGDLVMLAALCGATIFLGYVAKRYDDSSNKWEARINAQS